MKEEDKDTFSEHLKRLRAERAAMSREERKEAIAKDVKRYNERRKRLQNETVLLLTPSEGDKNGTRR
jgi:predicted nucleotide-binding protein (sugar kinase/HSP70/actin superfamily)